MLSGTVPTRGRLEEYPLAAVLRAILAEKRDGCLTASRGSVTRRLYLREGMIVSGSSNDKMDRLGEILIAQGKLTPAELKKFWDLSQSEHRLLGITLVLNGRITQTDLYQGVTAQVVTILDRLQRWRKGDYEFEEGCAPAPGTVLLRIPLSLFLRAETEKRGKKEKVPAASRPKSKKRTSPAAAAKTAAEAEELEITIPEECPDAGERGSAEAPAAVSAPEGAPDECDLISEVAFHVQELHKRSGQGPDALLGVRADAGLPAAQEAYHRLAKILHPDRLPRGLPEEVAREAGELFRDLTAAFQILSDQEAERKAGAPAPSAADGSGRRGRPEAGAEAQAQAQAQARKAYHQGREFITKGNYWQAANSLRQAVRLKPEETSFRRLLGLALVQTKRLHEAEEHIQEAIRLEPSNADNFLTLGRVYTTGRRYRLAREAYQRALRIDGRNVAAREEMASLPEEQPAEKRSGVSFIRKLFGKG